MNEQVTFLVLIGVCALIFTLLAAALLKWEWLEDEGVAPQLEVDTIDLNTLREQVLAAAAAKKSMDDFVAWLLETAIKYEAFYGGSEDFSWDEDDSDGEALVTLNGSSRWQRWTLEDHLSRTLQESDDLLEDLEILQEELEATKFRVKTRGLSLLTEDARNHREHSNHSVGYKNRR